MKRIARILAALLIVTLCVSSFGMAALAASKKVYATGSCNIRTGPALYYSSKGTLPKGKTATYLGSSRVDSRGVYWLKIKYHGKTGWVSTRYAKLSGSSYYYDDDDYYDDDYYSGDRVRATASLNVRNAPRTSAGKLGTISRGTSLTYRNVVRYDSKGNAWYGVRYRGQNAWVSSLYSYIV